MGDERFVRVNCLTCQSKEKGYPKQSVPDYRAATIRYVCLNQRLRWWSGWGWHQQGKFCHISPQREAAAMWFLPPMGAAKQQPTPTAQAADSISVFLSSFCPTRIRDTRGRARAHARTHTQSHAFKEIHKQIPTGTCMCKGRRHTTDTMHFSWKTKFNQPFANTAVLLWRRCCIFSQWTRLHVWVVGI